MVSMVAQWIALLPQGTEFVYLEFVCSPHACVGFSPPPKTCTYGYGSPYGARGYGTQYIHVTSEKIDLLC